MHGVVLEIPQHGLEACLPLELDEARLLACEKGHVEIRWSEGHTIQTETKRHLSEQVSALLSEAQTWVLLAGQGIALEPRAVALCVPVDVEDAMLVEGPDLEHRLHEEVLSTIGRAKDARPAPFAVLMQLDPETAVPEPAQKGQNSVLLERVFDPALSVEAEESPRWEAAHAEIGEHLGHL